MRLDSSIETVQLSVFTQNIRSKNQGVIATTATATATATALLLPLPLLLLLPLLTAYYPSHSLGKG